MDSLGILDLVIGLFFIYFVFSVICTSVVEGLSHLFQWRSRTLEKWLIDLFHKQIKAPSDLNAKSGDSPDTEKSSSSRQAGGEEESKDEGSETNDSLGSLLASHDLIRGLTRRKRKPDYIPAHIFSSALFSVLIKGTEQSATEPYDALKLKEVIKGSQLKQGLKDYLLQALEESHGSITLVRKRLETWFDYSMEGLTESYKKQTRIWTFFIAMLIAFSANVDTIALAKYLYENPAQAAILAAAAEKEVADSTLYKEVQKSLANIEQNLQQSKVDSAKTSVVIQQTKESIQRAQKQYHNLNAKLKATGLPLGWEGWNKVDSDDKCMLWVRKILGILLTAFALTLGAPFWFDMINKLVNIRSAGNKPATSTTNDHQHPAG